MLWLPGSCLYRHQDLCFCSFLSKKRRPRRGIGQQTFASSSIYYFPLCLLLFEQGSLMPFYFLHCISSDNKHTQTGAAESSLVESILNAPVKALSGDTTKR
ncbi:hypothetical protein ILYODFUR_035129 [Ilyodon furcidens]|uniref:Uncharacterized protein n=1 Tax=Ilyodon furcidens TaxID=33524 RepID=A0ABV0UCX5_9TELE